MGANRGWNGTKLHLALIAMALVTLAFLLMGHPETAFSTYCTTLIAAAGVYSSASTAEKFSKQKVEPPEGG